MRLREIITEASEPVPAKLYHGTSLFNVIAILRDMELLTSENYEADDEVTGVSLSDDRKVGEWFGRNSTLVWFEMNGHTLTPQHASEIEAELDRAKGAVLVLDGPRLAQRHQFERVMLPNRDGLDEREWRVVTDEPLALRPVLRGFHAEDWEIGLMADLLRRAPGAGWGNETPAMMEALRHHPMRLRA